MTAHETSIRVLVYSKYTLFREGLKAMLREGGPIEIIGEAATARKALHLAERLHPDVLLLELAAIGSDGSEFTRRIKELDPQVKVLVLSLQDNENQVTDCLSAGAVGYIRKDAQSEQLKGAIYRACRGAFFAA